MPRGSLPFRFLAPIGRKDSALRIMDGPRNIRGADWALEGACGLIQPGKTGCLGKAGKPRCLRMSLTLSLTRMVEAVLASCDSGGSSEASLDFVCACDGFVQSQRRFRTNWLAILVQIKSRN